MAPPIYIRRRRPPQDLEREELVHRRLAWAIPVTAIFLAIVGVLSVLRIGPGNGQGVRKIEPEPPPSSSAPASRPCAPARTMDVDESPRVQLVHLHRP